MPYRHSIGVVALMAALLAVSTAARAFDEAKYPSWKGQWLQLGGAQDSAWHPTKPPGAGQRRGKNRRDAWAVKKCAS